MAERRAWLHAAQPSERGWRGLTAVAYDTHVGCEGYALLSFDAEGRRTASERLPADNPDGAMQFAESAFGVDPASWRSAYAVLDASPLPWSEVERRMEPARLDRERRLCLGDQYGGLFDDVAKLVGEEDAAAILPMIRTVSYVEELDEMVGEDAEQIWEAWWNYPEVDRSEKSLLADVAEYGWHALWILSDDEQPEFGYSVGFYRTLEAPEVIVVGLRSELAHSMLWEAYRRFERGEMLRPGNFYDGFLEGHVVTAVEVSEDARRDYFRYGYWFYKDEFPALQLVWPSASDGAWPWESESLVRAQPVLGPTG